MIRRTTSARRAAPSRSIADSAVNTGRSVNHTPVDHSLFDLTSCAPASTEPSNSTRVSSDTFKSGADFSLSSSVIKTAVGVIKEHKLCNGVKFTFDDEMYYGVSESDLKGKSTRDRSSVVRLACILQDVTEECKATKLQDVMSRLLGAVQVSTGRAFHGLSRVYWSHAHRIMAQAVVSFQGYYQRHSDEIATLSRTRVRLSGSGKTPDAIIALYKAEVDIQNPLRTLMRRLESVSNLVCELCIVNDSSEQELISGNQLTSANRTVLGTATTGASGSRDEKRSAYSPTSTTGRSSSHQDHPAESRNTLVVILSYGASDLANREHLRKLAKICLVDDLFADPPVDFSQNLVSMSSNLPDQHEKYLHEQLLPYFTSKKILKVVVLATILGFSEVVSRIPKRKKLKRPSPLLIRRLRGIGFGLSRSRGGRSLPDTDLYEDLWNRDIEIWDGSPRLSDP